MHDYSLTNRAFGSTDDTELIGENGPRPTAREANVGDTGHLGSFQPTVNTEPAGVTKLVSARVEGKVKPTCITTALVAPEIGTEQGTPSCGVGLRLI
ncbi:MAG TPA: hypothetical protein EYQ84_08475 [Nitrospinaceae bacterium]|nr:hypothetical protein [Nitrospinaceae bacterium]